MVLTCVKLAFALLGSGAAGLAVAFAVTLPDLLAPISQLFRSGAGTGSGVLPYLWGARASFHGLCYCWIKFTTRPRAVAGCPGFTWCVYSFYKNLSYSLQKWGKGLQISSFCASLMLFGA